MTGWKEHSSQQKPKRRGSATVSFKDIQKQFGNQSWFFFFSFHLILSLIYQGNKIYEHSSQYRLYIKVLIYVSRHLNSWALFICMLSIKCWSLFFLSKISNVGTCYILIPNIFYYTVHYILLIYVFPFKFHH